MSGRREVLQSTAVNIGITLGGAVAGVVLARGLGPDDRGSFAVIMAWFAISLVVAEVGQSAAVTYWVARSADARSSYTSAASVLMLGGAVIVAAGGFFFADALGGGDAELVAAYRLVFLGCIANAIGAPIVYALQGLSITRWNVVRAVQPMIYLLAVVVVFLTGRLTIVAAALTVLGSFVLQLLVGMIVGRSEGLRPAPVRRAALTDLLSFGAAHQASAIPLALAAQYDRVILAWTVTPYALGQYAVALTVAQLCAPVSTAISSVVFPRSARLGDSEGQRIRLEQRSIRLTGVATLGTLILIVLAGAPFVPLVFGDDYSAAVPLVTALAPLMFLRSVNGMLVVLLRGRRRPGYAAVGQLVSLVIGAIALVAIGPTLGVLSAPLGLAVAEAVALAINLVLLRRARVRPAGVAADGSRL